MSTRTPPKPERLTLPDVSVEKVGDTLHLTHIKTGTKANIPAVSLQRWLVRKLRELF